MATCPNVSLVEERRVDRFATKSKLRSKRTQIESTIEATTIMVVGRSTTIDVETPITTSNLEANAPTVIETQVMTRLVTTTITEGVLSMITSVVRLTTQPRIGLA